MSSALRKRAEEAAEDVAEYSENNIGHPITTMVTKAIADAIEREAEAFAELAISEFYFQHTPLLAGEKLGTAIAAAIRAAKADGRP
jgi:hypothetical protein